LQCQASDRAVSKTQIYPPMMAIWEGEERVDIVFDLI